MSFKQHLTKLAITNSPFSARCQVSCSKTLGRVNHGTDLNVTDILMSQLPILTNFAACDIYTLNSV